MNKYGFTLLETVIYLAFLSLFAVTMSSVLYFFTDRSNTMSASVYDHHELQFIQQKMEYEIIHADSITYPLTSTSSSLIFVSGADHLQKEFLLQAGVPVIRYTNGELYPLTDPSNIFSSLIFDFSSTSSIAVSIADKKATTTFLILKTK